MFQQQNPTGNFDLVGLRWGLRICIFNEFVGDGDAASLGHSLRTTDFKFHCPLHNRQFFHRASSRPLLRYFTLKFFNGSWLGQHHRQENICILHWKLNLVNSPFPMNPKAISPTISNSTAPSIKFCTLYIWIITQRDPFFHTRTSTASTYIDELVTLELTELPTLCRKITGRCYSTTAGGEEMGELRYQTSGK